MFVTLAVVAVATFSTETSHAQSKAAAPEAPAVFKPVLDFTGDTSTDFSTLDIGAPGTPIHWKVLRNPASPVPGLAFIRFFDFGVAGDTTTPHDTAIANDFIGDGKTDVVVWRSETGQFIEGGFPEGGGPISATSFVLGGPPNVDNVGRDGDYDGDGKKDPTTVRVTGGLLTWNMQLSGGGSRSVQFGRTVTGRSTLAYQGADFTGDGRDELVFCTAATTGIGANNWWIGDAVTGAVVLGVANWGSFVTDYFLNPADYTGDGKADIVCMASGRADGNAGGWFIRDTATGNLVPPVIFGIADPNFITGDIPCRGNYDNDQKADICVWRPSNATYYWIQSSNGQVNAQQWGTANSTTEFPIATTFVF
jgi:hypothetical protein